MDDLEDLTPIRFIGEPIEVQFDSLPSFEKTPPCPNGFIWREAEYVIRGMLSEWTDFRRRGRFARNMQPRHLATAETRGSWGVGRFYFRVQVDNGRIFELYYDREPKDADQRKGSWYLYRELA